MGSTRVINRTKSEKIFVFESKQISKEACIMSDTELVVGYVGNRSTTVSFSSEKKR
jgi:hypothetical protein